jgi:1-acyl-sn-glycerol-3-phosphate acyltransferase
MTLENNDNATKRKELSGNSTLECSRFAHYIGKLFMRLMGWKVSEHIPQDKKMIVIAEPHTTNWDLLFLLGAAYSLGIRINWVGKKSIFKFPVGGIMRAMGGLALDRSKSGMVDAMSKVVLRESKIRLIISPSGTRKHGQFWRSGFYYIAKQTNIVIVCGFLDYKNKVAGLGDTIHVSDSVKNDMDKIRKFYSNITGKIPSKQSNIKLKEECEL